MAATLTNQVSSLLQANSDEVHGFAVGDYRFGGRLLSDKAVAKAKVVRADFAMWR